MPSTTKAQRTQARDAAVKASYQKMMEEKNYLPSRIRQLLAERHFLAVETIEKIVWGDAERRRQLRAKEKAAQAAPAPG